MSFDVLCPNTIRPQPTASGRTWSVSTLENPEFRGYPARVNPSHVLLAALLLLPAALRAAEADSLDAQFSALKQKAKASVAASQAVAAQAAPPPAPVIVSGVDMSEFLRRLEDMTLDTTVLRGLLGQISVSFRDPSSSENAKYGQIVNNMYLPTSMKDMAGTRSGTTFSRTRSTL